MSPVGPFAPSAGDATRAKVCPGSLRTLVISYVHGEVMPTVRNARAGMSGRKRPVLHARYRSRTSGDVSSPANRRRVTSGAWAQSEMGARWPFAWKVTHTCARGYADTVPRLTSSPTEARTRPPNGGRAPLVGEARRRPDNICTTGLRPRQAGASTGSLNPGRARRVALR